MAGVRVANLVKKYGETVAVNDVSLKINDGEFVVLLGPSGCGKTTTLRCIAGLEVPDSGDVFIDDVQATELTPMERDVAMVFQSYALYPHKSIFGNLEFPLKMRGMSSAEREKRVHETARLLNIEHLLSRKPRQLSGGEQQRVALGRSLVREPKVFLMDEPLSNLDAQLRLHTRTEIKRLHEELKITTIYVTHDQSEAMSMADKVAVMNRGRLTQYEDPMTIYTRPASTFVASFVGSPPMNFIEASVIHEGENTLLDAASFRCELPPSVARIVQQKLGSQVKIGIRPENLRLSAAREQDSIFEAEIYVIEPLGSSTVVDIRIGGLILKSVIQGYFRGKVGSKIWVGFSFEDAHLFDSNSGDLID